MRCCQLLSESPSIEQGGAGKLQMTLTELAENIRASLFKKIYQMIPLLARYILMEQYL
jgi:hypothetical protein